jgi:Gas vesicle synthesis protein GvpL/GvpF
MPLLAYCMMEAPVAVEMPPAGVGGTKVEELQDSGLCGFFSRFQSYEQIAGIPAVESALAFHQVLQALFSQAALISFRFPTVVESEEELRQHLREHAPRYTEALSRLRYMAQMEIHIGRDQGVGSGPPAASGREYLEQRQTQAADLKVAAEKFHQATRPWVVEWRERQTDEGMRCYALLRRDSVAGFQHAAKTLSQSLPGTRLSGPWPPAEFLEIKDF